MSVGLRTQGAGKPSRNSEGLQTTVPGTVLTRARLVDAAGAGEYLGISKRSVFRMIEKGELVPVRLPGLRRALRLDVHDLAKLVEAGKDLDRLVEQGRG